MGRSYGTAAPGLLQAGLILAMAVVMTGCFQGATVPEPPAGAPVTGVQDPQRAQIVFTALQMVGVPYLYGGETPRGFDCSGLVQYAYRSAGVPVPRTSREQLKASIPVSLDSATAGDLLFFQSKDYSHVGIYLGEGRFIHAPSTGKTVSIGSFNNTYYRRNFVRAGRMPTLVAGGPG